MALSNHTRIALKYALKSSDIGDEVADVIDAGSGTLSAAARERMEVLVADRIVGDSICDKIDAGSALSGREQDYLGIMLTNRVAATEIATELSS